LIVKCFVGKKSLWLKSRQGPGNLKL